MTATKRLRRLLDERGVEYKAWDGGTHPITVWYVDGQAFEFVEYRLINGAKQVSNNPWDNDGHCMLTITNRHCTPEQAIAATLGRGTLSAGQVSNAVHAHSIHADCADADWQAIADELNATLGSSNCTNGKRTNAACKPITYDNGYSIDHLEPGEYHEFWEPACACGSCGELIPMRKFCPNCGSRLEVDA